MKRRLRLSALLVMALAMTLASVPIWAQPSGNGTEGSPYVIDVTSTGGNSFFQQSGNNYHFKSGNNDPSQSYVEGSDISSVHVMGGEYVRVANKRPVTVYGGGHLIVGGASNVSGSGGGYVQVDATGASLTGGMITQLTGSQPIKMTGDTVITSGGGGSINNTQSNSHKLTLDSDEVYISGYFGTLTLGSTATAIVNGNTYIGTLSGSGSVTISGGCTLTLGSGHSITTKASGSITKSVQQMTGSDATLYAGEYAAVAGSWLVEDAVTVNATKRLDSSNLTLTDTNQDNTTFSARNGASLTLNGGSAKVKNATKNDATSESAKFSLTLDGATVELMGADTAVKTMALGTLTVHSGSLTIDNSTVGALNIDALTKADGALTVNRPLNIQETGGMSVTGGTTNTFQQAVTVAKGDLTVSAGTTFGGAVTVAKGDVSISANISIVGAVTVSEGDMSVTGGTNTFQNTVTVAKGGLTVSAGTNTFKQAVSAAEGVDVSAAGTKFESTVTIADGGMTVGASTTFDNTVTITKGGMTVTAGTNTFQKAVTIADGGMSVSAGSNTFKEDVTVAKGDLNIGAGTTFEGTVTVTAGSMIVTKGVNTFQKAVTVGGNLTAVNQDALVTNTLDFQDNVTVTGTAEIAGSTVTLAAGKTLRDSARYIRNDAASAISLNTWNSAQALLNVDNAYTVTLGGEWTLPEGKSATVKKADATGKATVIGTGGTLTLDAAADVVYAEGYFAVITVPEANTATLKISRNKPLCDANRSVTMLKNVSNVTTIEETEASISLWSAESATLQATYTGDTVGETQCLKFADLTGRWKINGYIHVAGTDGSAYSCGHTHVNYAEIDGTGTVYTSQNADVRAIAGTINVTAVGATYNVGDGGSFDAGTGNAVYVSGTYSTLKGEVILSGNTTVTVSAAEATVTGSGYNLTVNEGNVFVRGEFGKIDTKADDETAHAIMVSDTTVNGGTFGIRNLRAEDTADTTDTDLTTLTLNIAGGTAHVQGTFMQVNISGGTVTDCGKVTISKVDDPALTVSGGSVTLDDQCDISGETVKSPVRSVTVSGGSLQIVNGQVKVTGANGSAVFVSGGEFFLGKKDNEAFYNEAETPSIVSNGNISCCISVTKNGKAWLYDGEIKFQGTDSDGISVSDGGWVHIHPNDLYGAGDKLMPQLYVHGTQNTKSAMSIETGGRFEIYGQGAFFQEPRNNTDDQYALYIHDEADIEGYPLAGGTFYGKVYYDLHEADTLIAPNHYVRCDGRHDFSGTSVNALAAFFTTTQMTEQFFAPSDGTRGVVPSTKAEAEYNYGSYRKMHEDDTSDRYGYYYLRDDNGQAGNTFGYGVAGYVFTVADAEWELRNQMANEGGSYQLPAGIIDGNRLTLDGYVKAQDADKDCCNCLVYKRGDLDVSGGGSHKLYLAGRTLTFGGSVLWNRGEKSGSTVSTDNYDTHQTIHVEAGKSLAIRDCVKDGSGYDLTGDKHSGAYIGSGTVSYTVAEHSSATRAIYNEGTLDVYSARIEATAGDKASGIHAYSHPSALTTTLGMSGNENCDNAVITVLGKQQAIYAEGLAEVTLNGGVVGDTENVYGTAAGIVVNDAGGLDVNGGIVIGKDTGIWTKDNSITKIYAGHIFGGYAADSDSAADSNSIRMDDSSTVYLNVDDAHRNYSETTVDDKQTSASHHINNVTIHDGMLWIGRELGGEISDNTRINGKLTANGGETVVFDGVVYGKTTVVGANAADFGTRFFVDGGSFGDLTVQNYAGKTDGYTTGDGVENFEMVVQIHGGTFRSMNTEQLKLGSSTATVDHLLGVWSDDYDVTNDNTPDMAQFRHYVTADETTRDEHGNYSEAALHQDDAERSVGKNGSAVGGEGKAVTVRDAYQEFRTWFTTGSGAYALPTNLLLSGLPCAPALAFGEDFHCEALAGLPLEGGSGSRTLDMNSYSILGTKADGVLMDLNSGKLVIRTGKSGNNLFENLADNADALTADSGMLTLGDAEDENGVTVEAKRDSLKSGSGSITVNKGTVTGGTNGVNAASGAVTVSGGTVTGTTGCGIVSASGTVTVKDGTITGGTSGVSAGSGAVTVKDGAVTGGTDGVNSDTGAVTVSGGTVTGTAGCGVLNASGAVAVKGGTVTGGTDGVNSASGAVSVTDSGSVTGTADCGIESGADVTLSGATVNGVTGIRMTTSGTLTAIKETNTVAATTGTAIDLSADVTGAKLTAITATGTASLVTASTGTITLGGTASLENGVTQSGGTVNVEDAAQLGAYALTGGMLNVKGGTTGALTQSGADSELTIRGGTLASVTQTAGKATVSGSTTITGAFDKSGDSSTASLGGGTYGSIKTATGGEKLSDIITSSVTDSDSQKLVLGDAADITAVSANAPYTIKYVTPAVVGGGGGGGGGGGAAAPATTISVSGDENSVSISAVVSNGTVTMTEPTAKELEQVIGAGVGTGEIVIDMSNLNSSVNKAEVPANTVKAIEKAMADTANDADELTIELPGGSVTFDAAAMAAVTKQMKGTKLDLTISKITEKDLTATQKSAIEGIDGQSIFSITLSSGGSVISSFRGGSATVTVPYTLKADQDPKGIVVWYVANDGSMTEIPAAYSDGEVTFTVGHFSEYVIAYDAERTKACPQDDTCPISAFTDAKPTEWYHDGVHWALENGVMNGVGDGKFAPNDTTTRAQVVTMLWRLEGSPAYVGMSEFSDVDNEEWYGPAIRWASAEGIVNGYDGKFAPNNAVTREQLVTILYRYAQYKKMDVSKSEGLDSFADATSIHKYAADAMQWAVGSGIVSGVDKGGKLMLAPADASTRVVVATMLWRFSK